MADQLIKWEELLEDRYSCLIMVESLRAVTFPNYFIGNIAKGVKELFDLELKTHDDRMYGTVIAHEKMKILVASFVSDLRHVTFDVSVDSFVFSPQLGSILRGIVISASRDSIGCLVHDCVNALLVKSYGQDWDSCHVKVGDSVLFEVTHLDILTKLLFIKGKLLEVEEKENDGQHLEDAYDSKMASATLLPPIEKSVNDMANSSLIEKSKPCVKHSTVDVDDEKDSSSVKSDRIEPSKISKRKHNDKCGGKAKKMKLANGKKPKKHREKDKKDDSSRKKTKASKTKDKSKRAKDKSSKRVDDEVTKSNDRKTAKAESKVKLKSDVNVELESSKPKKKVKAEKKDGSAIETERSKWSQGKT